LDERLHSPDKIHDRDPYNKIDRDHRIGEQLWLTGEYPNLDVHQILWNTANDTYEVNTGEILIGLDVESTNSVGNVLNSFYGVEGNYTIVSRGLHILRCKMIERWARGRGKVSDNLNIKYVTTENKPSTRERIYDTLALGKELVRQNIFMSYGLSALGKEFKRQREA